MFVMEILCDIYASSVLSLKVLFTLLHLTAYQHHFIINSYADSKSKGLLVLFWLSKSQHILINITYTFTHCVSSKSILPDASCLLTDLSYITTNSTDDATNLEDAHENAHV